MPRSIGRVEHTRLGIPILMHEESLHGYVARGATSFPQAIALASTWDPDLVTPGVLGCRPRGARARSNARPRARRRCRARSALGPDRGDLRRGPVSRDPNGPRRDPRLPGVDAAASADKVFVTLKHFTGHGWPESGTNVGPAHLGERELREIFFPPFEAR